MLSNAMRSLILAALLALVLAGTASARPAPLVPAAPHVTWIQGLPPTGGWPDFRAAEADGIVWYTRAASYWDLQHEMGHAFDDEVLTDRDRRRLRPILGAYGLWITADGGPNEAFADWYANARLHQGPGYTIRTRYGPAESWEIGYGSSPRSVRVYRRFIRLARRSAVRAGLNQKGR